MGLIAAFAYLRTLREAQGLSQETVAHAIGVSAKQVYRWEGVRPPDPGATALARYTAMVGGAPEHVHQFLLRDDVTAEDGAHLATLWFQLRIALGKSGTVRT